MLGEQAQWSQLDDENHISHFPPTLQLLDDQSKRESCLDNWQLTTECKNEPTKNRKVAKLSPAQITNPQNWELNGCCFKPLSWKMFSCAAKADKYKIKEIHSCIQYCFLIHLVHLANTKWAPAVCRALSEVLWCRTYHRSGGHPVGVSQPTD